MTVRHRYTYNTPSHFLVAAATCALLFTGACRAAITLEFAVTENTYDSKLEKIDGKDQTVPHNTTEQFTETVVLDDRRFSLSKGDDTTVYDFTNNQIIFFNNKDHTYYQRSLFSVVAFNLMEFKNRQFLSDVLSKSGVDNNPMGRLPTEHLFSIHYKKNPLTLAPTQSGDWIRYGHKDMPLIRFQRGEKIQASKAKAYVQFLRYRLGGHPLILDALLEQQTIPRRLEFSRYNMNRQVLDYQLSSMQKNSGLFPDIVDFREIAGDDADEIETLIFNNRKLASQADRHFNELIANAEKHYQDKNYLSSMLSYLEFTLTKGADLPASFHDRKTNLTANQQVRQLMKHINPSNKEEAELAVKTLTSLREFSGDTKHVMDIFIGNIRANLGEDEQAHELLFEAIKKNGMIAGVYKDLGDSYFNAYQTRLAWLCWDFARQIANDHKMLQHINAYENELVENFPEFFL